jgi:hypothetical protein
VVWTSSRFLTLRPALKAVSNCYSALRKHRSSSLKSLAIDIYLSNISGQEQHTNRNPGLNRLTAAAPRSSLKAKTLHPATDVTLQPHVLHFPKRSPAHVPALLLYSLSRPWRKRRLVLGTVQERPVLRHNYGLPNLHREVRVSQ